jgi:rhomboid family protein
VLPIRDSVRARSFPVINYMIIAACVGAFLLEIGAGDRVESVITAFGVVPARFMAALAGQVRYPGLEAVTVVTSMFLHAGLAHILGNMWFLHVFGDGVEDAMGHFRYGVFYLLTGTAAALTHVWFSPDSMLPTVGASGAISGVMGAYMVLYPRARIVTLVPIFFYITFLNVPALFFLAYWFVIQFLSGGMELAMGSSSPGGTAWWAHIGGFAAGVVLALPFSIGRRRSQSTARL